MKKTNFLNSKKISKVFAFAGIAFLFAIVLCFSFHFNPLLSLGSGGFLTALIGAGKVGGLLHAIVIPTSATKSSPKVTQATVQPAAFAGLGIAAPQVDHQFEDPTTQQAVNKSVLPNKFTVTVAAAAAMNSLPTLIYLFNPSAFAPVTAATGQGTNNITYQWSDQNDGLTIERVLFLARFGIGAILYGFSMSMVTNTGGVITDDVIGLGNSNPAIGVWDCFGDFNVQENFVASSNQTRKDTNFNLFVTRCAHNLSAVSQFRFLLPVNGAVSGDQCQFTFYLTPNFEL